MQFASSTFFSVVMSIGPVFSPTGYEVSRQLLPFSRCRDTSYLVGQALYRAGKCTAPKHYRNFTIAYASKLSHE